jgi:hypothetical protein
MITLRNIHEFNLSFIVDKWSNKLKIVKCYLDLAEGQRLTWAVLGSPVASWLRIFARFSKGTLTAIMGAQWKYPYCLIAAPNLPFIDLRGEIKRPMSDKVR